jgi:Domain of unknown function (DUF1735)
MKYLNLTKQFPLILGAIALFSSCKKVENFKSIGDSGQTIVRLIDAGNETNISGKALINLELLTTPQSISMVRILREVPNAAELTKAMTVIVKDDAAAVTAYNTAHATTFVPLPAASYIVDAANPRAGGNYTVSLKAGEFAKDLKFTLPNASTLDLNLAYAFGFTITTVDAAGKISGDAKTIIVEVGVKNKYDGIYSVESGNVQRYTAGVPEAPGGLNGSLAGNSDVILATTGANTVSIPPSSQVGHQVVQVWQV